MSVCNNRCSGIGEPKRFGVRMYDLGFVKCLTCNLYFKKSNVIKKGKNRKACLCCGAWVRTRTPHKNPKRLAKDLLAAELVTLA